MSEENGLLAVQNVVTDADLVAELTLEVDKAVASHETEEEGRKAAIAASNESIQAKLDALDNPVGPAVVGTVVPGITEATVAGDKGGDPPSDRSILRDQLVEFANSKRPAADASAPNELEQLRAANQALIQGKLADPVAFLKSHGLSPEGLMKQQQAPESVAQRALAAAEQARAEAAQYRQELVAQQDEARLNTLRTGVVDYATAQGDKYPLVNDGQQGLVFDAMVEALQNEKPISEDEALAHVEGKLRTYVEQAAARLGFVRPNGSNAPQATSNAPAHQAVTLNAESPSAPPSKAWNDLSFTERDEALLKLL